MSGILLMVVIIYKTVEKCKGWVQETRNRVFLTNAKMGMFKNALSR